MFTDHADPGPDAHQEEVEATLPRIAVPALFPGTEAEAVALAVAGAVQDIASERDKARATAVALEQDLAYALSQVRYAVAQWPDTSWAHDSLAKETLESALAELTDPERAAERATLTGHDET